MWAKAFFRRLAALTRKEFYQLLRDKSSMLLGIVMLSAVEAFSLSEHDRKTSFIGDV